MGWCSVCHGIGIGDVCAEILGFEQPGSLQIHLVYGFVDFILGLYTCHGKTPLIANVHPIFHNTMSSLC